MIGIDKTTINNIGIISIDFKKLKSCDNVIWSKEGATISLQTNIPGQYQEVSYIKITDEHVFNTFNFGIKLNGGRMVTYCLIELHIRSLRGDNMNPLSMEAYKRMLQEVKQYISERYGIRLNFDDIGFKEIEINCTFKLDRDFKEYEYLLDRFLETAPKRYKDRARFTDNYNNIKEIVFFNKSAKLKVYDKKKQLHDVYKIKINDNLMRIEYTFNRSQKVEDVFGSNKVGLLTDEAVKEYIKEAIDKDLIKPLLNHVEEGNKELLKIAKKYQKLYPRGWGKRFIDDVRTLKIIKEYKEKDGIKVEERMLLVDNQQLKDVLNKIMKNKQSLKRLYKEIECIKATDGNLLKLEYIHDNIL